MKLIGFGINQDQMGIINFTGLIPNLNITDNNDTHLFYLSATSTYGKQSEDYVLNITTPKNFMLLPTEPVKMKSKEVTIPVKLKEGNPQNIKLYYRYYGVIYLPPYLLRYIIFRYDYTIFYTIHIIILINCACITPSICPSRMKNSPLSLAAIPVNLKLTIPDSIFHQPLLFCLIPV